MPFPFSPLRTPGQQRNFWLGVLNGLSFSLAETLIDPTLVLVALISRLTDSPILIGIVTPLRDGAWYLPQLWLSGYVQNLPRKLSLYRRAAVVRIVAWGLVPAFACAGIRDSGLGVSSQPLLLEIAPAAERTLYLGFTNTLLGIVLFSTTLSGVIVALFGFSALVALTIAAHLVGLAAAARMRETGRGLV